MSSIDWDLIVVGSGPSGGRIAADFVKKGAKVLLLEAGSFFRAKDFPKPEISSSAQMFWGGGAELSTDARLGFLRAKCVGGTSVVNQALLDRFDDYVWSEWKNITGINFSDAYIAEDYEAVEKSVTLQTIPEKAFGKNTRLFLKAFEKKNFGWAPLRRGQSHCDVENGNDCMACLGGCPRNSKQSTLVTSVEPSLEKGLTLIPNCEVNSIEDYDSGVVVKAVLNKKDQATYKAKALVIAGGSFGTSKILLQSGFEKKLPALGKGIACHPQYMTYALFNEPIDAFKGAFQGVKSYDDNLRKMGLKFENVFAPPIATAMLFAGHGRKHQEEMKRYRYLASMEVAIRDEASGSLSIGKGGKLLVNKKITDQDRARADKGVGFVREMYSQLGAKEVIACEQGFGLHLMGGCAIGTDEKKSVVNPEFRVHGTKKVFVADSSIFPSAPGLNPSLTIMALSQKAIPFIERSLA
ncbi:MAG: GMC family oxidoreductase [Bdellovibrionota bacterium]